LKANFNESLTRFTEFPIPHPKFVSLKAGWRLALKRAQYRVSLAQNFIEALDDFTSRKINVGEEVRKKGPALFGALSHNVHAFGCEYRKWKYLGHRGT
jgi:hypothetical protein